MERRALGAVEAEGSGLRVQVVRRAEDLADIEAAWRALQDWCADATVFSTWEWNSVAARHFARGAELRAILLERDDAPVALAPFARRRYAGLRTLVLLGTGRRDYSAADYQDLLLQPGEESPAANAIIEALADDDGWDMVWLQELPPWSRALEPLAAAARQRGWRVAVRPHSDTYRIGLPDSWADYESQLSKRTRSGIGRRLRRLVSEQSASFRRVGPAEDPAQAMESLFALHSLRMRSAGKAGIFGREWSRAFHRELAATLHAAGMLNLTLLEMDGRVAGARYCFDHRGTSYFYASGFDPAPEWSKYSLGQAMDAHAIREAIDSGLRYEDFLRGDGDYKRHYAPERLDNRQLLIFRHRRYQRQHRIYEALRPAAGKVVRTLGGMAPGWRS